MSSAATPAAAEQQHAAPRRRRQTKPPVARRSAIQLLVGVLIVGAIPIVSTVRILQANALRNEEARADSALSDQLQNGLRELGRLGDNASTTAHDLAGSPVVQRAVITGDTATLRRLAGQTPGLAVYLRGKRVAGDRPGLLSHVAKVFMAEHVDIHNSKIMTVGERAEDVFYVADESGRPLTSEAQQRLAQRLTESLDRRA